MINQEVLLGNWKPLIACRNALKLSHPFFADDIIFMVVASIAQMSLIMDIMNKLCSSSGLRVSNAKSRIFMSKNVNLRLAARLKTISGFKVTNNLGNYLGVPILYNQIKDNNFANLLAKA